MTAWAITAIDRATLPTALLPLAKSQSRVQFTRDDAYLTELAAQAIDDIERRANSNFFDITVAGTWDTSSWCAWWSPPPGTAWNYTAGYGLVLPFNNVRSFTATDALDADVSASYSLEQTDPGGVGRSVLWGAQPMAPGAPVVFVFLCGVLTVEDLAPAVRRAVLRRCAALYENREAPLAVDDDSMISLWRPSV